MTEQTSPDWPMTPPIMTAPHVAMGVMKDPEVPFVSHAFAVTVENGLEIKTVDTEAQQPFPRRSSGARKVSELDSFIAELARRPLDERGTLWGTAEAGKLTAVYNDHDTNPMVGGWRDDQLILQLKQDPDWAAWHTMSGQYFRQEEFGERVEELLHTVTEPDQAELLEIIDSVRASTKGEFQSSINRANGAQSVVFNTEISTTAGKATNSLEVPQFIKMQLRPWDGHPTTYEVVAYFRLKVESQRLTLAIKLKPTRQIIRSAWVEISEAVSLATEKPVYAQ